MNSGAIRNHISSVAIKRIGLPYRQKQDPYPLITILGDPILYKDGIIHLETGPVQLDIKRRTIVILFNVLPLGKDKAVLGILFLQEFNPKIDWITGEVKITDTKN